MDKTELAMLSTEMANERTTHIDQMTTFDMVKVMNDEDKTVAGAVEKTLPQIAKAVDEITLRLKGGGRLFYVGAGTSGRLGVLDAAELPPTFGVEPELVQGIIAGGKEAMFVAQEGAEDNEEQGGVDLKLHGLTPKDVVIGLAASGRTPYVFGALTYAKSLGAVTIALACVPNPRIGEAADIIINPVTGPEAITGSTRLKAGTAEKMALNLISTAVMVKLGRVRGNLMVNVRATNEKLRARKRDFGGDEDAKI